MDHALLYVVGADKVYLYASGLPQLAQGPSAEEVILKNIVKKKII